MGGDAAQMRGVGLQAGQLQLCHGEDDPGRVRRGGRAGASVPSRHAPLDTGGLLQSLAVRGSPGFGCCCCCCFCLRENHRRKMCGGNAEASGFAKQDGPL